MQIIISPAKKMRVDNDDIGAARLPVFLTKTEELLTALRALDYKSLQKLWQCNNAIAELNYNRLQRMDLRRNLTPAVFSYDGLQYQHIAPNVLDEAALKYLEGHLKILSGFYGILSAFDGVCLTGLRCRHGLPAAGQRTCMLFGAAACMMNWLRTITKF